MHNARPILKILGWVWLTLILPFTWVSIQVIEQLPRKGFPQNLYDSTLGFLFLPGLPLILTCSVLGLLLFATLVMGLFVRKSRQEEAAISPGAIITTNTVRTNREAVAQIGSAGNAMIIQNSPGAIINPPVPNIRGQASLHNQIRDYTNTIEEKTRNFVGREFVFDEAKHFIEAHQSGYFFIEGDPGIGKTALAAQMVKTHEYVHHFNIRGEGIDNAEQFLSNICAQLIVAYHLEYSSLPPDTTHDAGFLNRLLREIASKLGSTDNVVIVVDALDEVDTHTLPPGTNPLYLPLTLPQGIFIIVTTRRGVTLRVEHEPHILKLNADDERNKVDVRAYIEQHIGQSGIQTYITNHQTDDTSFIRRLEEKSEGNFMYLHHVLRDIEEGAYGDLKFEDLPRGLENYYEDHWKRMGMMATPLPHTKIVIIYLLAEVLEPTSLRFIADCASTDAPTVQQVLDEWDPFLHKSLIEGEHRYSIYHTSFSDFLHRKETVQAVSISLPEINDLIAQNLMRKLGLE